MEKYHLNMIDVSMYHYIIDLFLTQWPSFGVPSVAFQDLLVGL